MFRAFIDQAVADGCSLITGGSSAPAGFPVGYYVQPTIFTDVAPRAAIAQAEVFGPVLCLIGYQSVQGRNRHRQRHPLRAFRRRMVQPAANGPWPRPGRCAPARSRSTARPFNVRAPFGGYKQSGYGRELGPYGIEEYLQTKAIHL